MARVSKTTDNIDWIGPVISARTNGAGGNIADVPLGEWLNIWADNRTEGVRRDGDFSAVATSTDRLSWSMGSTVATADQAFLVQRNDRGLVYPVLMGGTFTFDLERPTSGFRVYRIRLAVQDDAIDSAVLTDLRAPFVVIDSEEGGPPTAPLVSEFPAYLDLHEFVVYGSGAVQHNDLRVVSAILDKTDVGRQVVPATRVRQGALLRAIDNPTGNTPDLLPYSTSSRDMIRNTGSNPRNLRSALYGTRETPWGSADALFSSDTWTQDRVLEIEFRVFAEAANRAPFQVYSGILKNPRRTAGLFSRPIEIYTQRVIGRIDSATHSEGVQLEGQTNNDTTTPTVVSLVLETASAVRSIYPVVGASEPHITGRDNTTSNNLNCSMWDVIVTWIE